MKKNDKEMKQEIFLMVNTVEISIIKAFQRLISHVS